jgi:hypothetical protein
MSTARSWYDITVTEEDRLLALSLEDWTAERRRIVETHGKASGAFVNRIDYVRRTLWHAKKDNRPIAQDPPQLRYYRDIADEPWKYGDDAFEQWTMLDNDLPKFPGRWRVDAYWTRREEEEVLEPSRRRLFELLTRAQSEFMARVAAATKIQALVRGHQLRCSVRYMDCAECLGHGVAPCEVEGRNICRACFDTLGWNECTHCGMPVHADRLAEFSGCCSRECMTEVMIDDGDDMRPCEACGADVPTDDIGEYRMGYWCSRACAYG